MTAVDLFIPALVTLDYVLRHRTLAVSAADVDQKALLVDLIDERSADFATMVARGVLMPYRATKQFGSEHRHAFYDLRFYDDLLEVTTLTNADSIVISSGYALRPDNVYPKTCIQLTMAGGLTWQFAELEDRVTVAGWWGYAPHYATCWRNVLALPNGQLADTTSTSVTLAASQGALFEILQYLRIDDEIVQVTAITGDVLTVTRGELGTTAAAHSSTPQMRAYKQLPDIMRAVREMVVFDYLSKDRVGGRISVYQGGVVEVNSIDPALADIAKRHQRFYAPEPI